MGLWNLIVRFFQGGGEFMYPIAIVFVVGLAIAVERYIYLTHMAVRNRGLWNEIVPLLSQGNFRQVAQATSKSSSAIGHILNYGLARIQSARRRDDIEKAMEESLMEVVPQLENATRRSGVAEYRAVMKYAEDNPASLERMAMGQDAFL